MIISVKKIHFIIIKIINYKNNEKIRIENMLVLPFNEKTEKIKNLFRVINVKFSVIIVVPFISDKLAKFYISEFLYIKLC